MKQVMIYTDGACSGNPGPGGWAALVKYKETVKEISGGEAQTTNNRGTVQSGSVFGFQICGGCHRQRLGGRLESQ